MALFTSEPFHTVCFYKYQ